MTTALPADGAALELESVTKAFGGLTAVSDVTLRVERSERRALIGPNGAGKTTLFYLITGELPATRGRIRLFGEDLSRDPPHRRIARGLGRTYQVTNVFPALTVEDNVRLAALGLDRRKFSLLRPVPRSGELQDRVAQALVDVGLADKARVPARELSHGEQRQLELALAIVARPRVLLLDEPAAGLSAAERGRMTALIRALPRDMTVVLVEHDMDLALGAVDRVSCLHRGKVIAEGSPAEIRQDRGVQDVYLGVG